MKFSLPKYQLNGRRTGFFPVCLLLLLNVLFSGCIGTTVPRTSVPRTDNSQVYTGGGAMEFRIITADIAPMYKDPIPNSELADEALFGMVVEVLGEENGLFRIKTSYRYEGYVSPNDVSKDSVDSWINADKWTVTAPYVDIREYPRVQASLLASSPRAGLLAVIKEDEWPKLPGGMNGNGWTYVGLPDDRKGYVKTVCIMPEIKLREVNWIKDNEEQLRKDLVNTAKLYMGSQYRWGGKTPLGIDCSGLTSIVYLMHGMVIFRDADIRPGFILHDIKREEMKEGDLLFFRGHVAMYTGNDEYIHATGHHTSVGVVMNSLNPDSPIYRDDLARGILKIGSVF